MSNEQQQLNQIATPNGIAALHHQSKGLPILVAPNEGDERNTVIMQLVPIACWKVDDLRFDFDWYKQQMKLLLLQIGKNIFS